MSTSIVGDTKILPEFNRSSTGPVILPPSDVQAIIHSTANYISTRGTDVESVFLERDTTGRVAFLRPGHVYHAYYRAFLKYGAEIPEELFTTHQDVVPTSTTPFVAFPTASAPMGVVMGASTVSAAPSRVKADSSEPSSESLYDQLTSHIRSLSLAASTEAELNSLPPAPAPLTPVYSVRSPSAFAPIEVALCRLTALFAARNGQTFVRMLAQSPEGKDKPELAFIHPRHPLFNYFKQLVDAYGAVIAPPSETLEHIRAYAKDGEDENSSTTTPVSSSGVPRAERSNLGVAYMELRLRALHRRAEILRETENAVAEEEENLTMQLIDWHDFTVVETLTFDPMEDLYLPEPEPDLMSIERAVEARQAVVMDEVATMAAAQESRSTRPEMHASDISDDTMAPNLYTETYAGLEGYGEDVTPASGATGVMLLEEDGALEVLNEDQAAQMSSKASLAAREAGKVSQICPYCGLDVPVDALEEHIRIELLDPRWQEQRRLEAQRRKETNEASGADVTAQVQQFNRSRMGLSGDEESRLGAPKKTFQEIMAEQNQGTVGTGGVVSRQMQHQQHTAIAGTATTSTGGLHRSVYSDLGSSSGRRAYHEEPAVKRAKQEVFAPPPPSGPPPPPTSAPPPPPPSSIPPSMAMSGAGADGLVPEASWLAVHSGPAVVYVQLPAADESEEGREFGFDGRRVAIQLDSLALSVGEFKTLACLAVNNQLQPNKIKMKVVDGSIFLNKDSYSLAYYNVKPNAVVELGLRVRGGKRG